MCSHLRLAKRSLQPNFPIDRTSSRFLVWLSVARRGTLRAPMHSNCVQVTLFGGRKARSGIESVRFYRQELASTRRCQRA